MAGIPIPFSTPPWLQGLPSPYHTESHRKWQKACQEFMLEHLHAHALEWENDGDVPQHVFRTFSAHNMLIPALPAPLPIELLKSQGIHDFLGVVSVEDFDYTHFSIYISELRASGLPGPSSALMSGVAYAVPPLIKYGNKTLQDKFVPKFLKGEIRACIGITEPGAGSDVANISTSAVKSSDGAHYIVNGAKKWITNGIWADYCTMAVRTGGSGPSGLSLLLVPLKNNPGVNVRRIKVGGGTTGGTSYIDLDDVKVPAENLIGKEGQGMKMIMTNFNHERLLISIGVTRSARVALSSAFSYVMKREAFNKPLMDQPVVRYRLAKCGAELESLSAWVDQLVYQMGHLEKTVSDIELGGLTAMAKARAGIVFEKCARCAVLLLGGNGFTRTGQGELVEKLSREVPGARIPGGSEDVLLDLSVRQLLKNYKAKVRALESPKI
ncbi:acyl-CoA dehydrogenase/oxidase [Aspergillus ambiguus]|uniref:acyl-CoA dehydrogenase family protein n=1 Tax=Aspergillus ambiguus TaxID=176160 RepID=UPI003CCCD13E